MPKRKYTRQEILEMIKDCWPDFLNYLDIDPPRAFEGFYEYAELVFQAFAPSKLKSFINSEDREDAVRDFAHSCVRNNFRKLRLYANKGQPMSIWLVFIANRYFLDRLRAPSHEHDSDEPIDDSPSTDPQPDIFAINSQLSCLLRTTISKLSEKCQLLLAFVLDDISWIEAAEMLGLGEGGNVKLSNDARWCQGRLKKMLEETEGFRLADYL